MYSKDLKNVNKIITISVFALSLGIILCGCNASEQKIITEEVTKPTHIENADTDTVNDKPDSANQITSEENSSEDIPKEADTVVVDICDYLDQYTKDYGGELENMVASKLNKSIEYNEEFDSYDIDDGAISFFGATDGTGFFVDMNKPVEGFSIYGIYVGMEEKEAEKILKDQGLEENDGMYSTDIDNYYITFNSQHGIIQDVHYTRIMYRDDMEDVISDSEQNNSNVELEIIDDPYGMADWWKSRYKNPTTYTTGIWSPEEGVPPTKEQALKMIYDDIMQYADEALGIFDFDPEITDDPTLNNLGGFTCKVQNKIGTSIIEIKTDEKGEINKDLIGSIYHKDFPGIIYNRDPDKRSAENKYVKKIEQALIDNMFYKYVLQIDSVNEKEAILHDMDEERYHVIFNKDGDKNGGVYVVLEDGTEIDFRDV